MTGRVALVTGASRGIGAATARAFATSEQAGFITGSTVVIDGGLLAGTPTFAAPPGAARQAQAEEKANRS